MVKLVVGLAAVTIVTLGSGLAAAQSKPNLAPATTGYSKDQCKNGGWQTLTDANGNRFKNQGDCVSYFATGGRNPGNG